MVRLPQVRSPRARLSRGAVVRAVLHAASHLRSRGADAVERDPAELDWRLHGRDSLVVVLPAIQIDLAGLLQPRRGGHRNFVDRLAIALRMT